MRSITASLTSLLLSICAFGAGAQSADERVAAAMNNADWFALDSIMNVTPRDSVTDFLEVFSRCLTGNRLNRPDVSIPAFGELLSTHGGAIGLANLTSSAMMFALDLSHTERNAEAAEMMSSVLEATRQYLDSATCASMQRLIGIYTGLSRYNTYGVTFADTTGRIPFAVTPVGKPEKATVLMTVDQAYINGAKARICFDTGAGANIISDSLATVYGLEPVEADARLLGVDYADGSYAIARELRLGNITVTDVPFIVTDITSHNAEADQYVDAFSIVVGSDLMLRLKDVTIDFVNREISVPASAPARTDARPNMCFSPSMNLLTRGTILGERMLMCLDTGDASYGTLDDAFYTRNRAYIEANGRPDSIREAGLGGVHISRCYEVPDMPLHIGGNTTAIPQMTVKTEAGKMRSDYNCIIGLKSMMLYGKVRFNMVDFVFTTLPPASPAPHHLVAPSFSYTPAPGPKAWQIIGNVILEGTHEYLTTH